MIALDTNVLVRLVVRDDHDQFQRALALIQRTVGEERKVHLSDVVLAELAWVLERAYGLRKAEVLVVLKALEGAQDVVFRSDADVARAISAYESGACGFADYLMGETSRSAGATVVYTFDDALAAGPGFAMP